MLVSLCRKARWVVLLGALALGWTLRSDVPLGAQSPDSAPALPAPSGSVVTVSTVSALQSAISSLASNRTIVISPGTYHLTSTLWINGTFSNVTIRGATNNRNDVVLVGSGMTTASSAVPFGIWTGGNVTNLTIANLTIRDIYQHPIIFNAGTESPRVYNVRLLDAGEQFIKANPDGAGGGVDNGIVEYSVIEHTTNAPDDYTNGVDVHGGRGWIVRHNLFKRIRSSSGLAGPAILMWNGSSDSIAEGNTFIDCHREISFGLIERTPNDHTGGIIRNNFIYRNAGMGGDVGIAVFDSPSTQVLHNTIFLSGTYPNAIEYRFPHTTGVAITNNLGDRPVEARDGASGSVQGNVWTALSSWFVDPAAANLHLKSTSTAAIDKGVATSVTNDWDGQGRPSGAAPDVGADEFIAAAPPSDTTAPSVSLSSPAGGATVSGTVTVTATATDNVGVSGVWFLLNGNNLGAEDTTAPYQTSWNTTTSSNGSHTVRAVARDAAGNTAMSPIATITVSNTTPDTTAPAVSVTAPSAGATVSGSIALTASASDNVGVAGVRFTVDGVSTGSEDTAAPFQITWNSAGVGNGSHAIRAIARDAAGNSTTSAAVTVTVSNATPDTTAPTVTMTAPTPGATVSGTVTLRASASDNIGVVGVRFTVDGTNSGSEDTASPYQVSLDTTGLPNGTHTVRAVARDAAGNTTTSSALSVTISNPVPPPPPPPPSSQVLLTIESPTSGQAVSPPFNVTGWAIDTRSTDGPGIMFIQVWAVPHAAGRAALYLGWINPLTARTDVANTYGARFRNSGFSTPMSNVPPGAYTLAFYPYSTASGSFEYGSVKTVPLNVGPGAVTVVDTPLWGQVYGNAGIGMVVSGWAVDARVPAGAGIDVVHVWAVNATNGVGTFLGEASLGGYRSEPAAYFGGTRFGPSGFSLTNGVGLGAGTYYILVISHSIGAASFNVTTITAAIVQ